MDVGDGETAARHAEALRGPAAGRGLGCHEALEAQPGAAVHHQHAPAGSQPQARASAPSARCRSPSASTRAWTRPTATSASSPTCERTPRRSRASRWPRRRRSSRIASASRYGTGKGRFFKTKAEGRPGGARVDPPDLVPAGPGLDAGQPQGRRAQALPPDLAARASRRRWRPRSSRRRPSSWSPATTACAPPPPGRCSTASPRVYTEGQDDAAEEAERTPAAAARGRRHHRRVRHAHPALHRAAAPLHGGDADQGARGERHRPPVHVRRHHLDHRGSRLRQGRGAPAPPRGDRRDRHGLPGRSTSASTWTSRSRRAWRRSSTRSPAAQREWVPLLRAFFGPLRDRVDEMRKQVRRSDITTEETDEVCSEGHPMVIRLGRNGKFLACSTYPDHKETRPLPGEEAPKLEGDGDPCPQCGEGVLATKRGQVRRVRGLLAVPGLHVHQEGRPAAPGPAPVRGVLSEERRRPPGRASRAAHRERLLGVLRLSRSATSRRTTSRPAPSTTPTRTGTGPVARKGEAGLCLACGAAVELPDGTLVGLRLAGGPADPSALAKPARARGCASRAVRRGHRYDAANDARPGRHVPIGGRNATNHPAVSRMTPA